jgi:ADP-ribose pyrophosphatase YjhB (NUDIX family)
MKPVIWYDTFAEFRQAMVKKYNGPFPAVDMLIRYPVEGRSGTEMGVVLVDTPNGIGLPGGMIDGDNYLIQARKESKEEVNLRFIIDKPTYRPFAVLSDPKQDARAYIPTTCYTGRGVGMLKRGDDAKAAMAFTLEEIAGLITIPEIWRGPHHITYLQIYLDEVAGGLR